MPKRLEKVRKERLDKIKRLEDLGVPAYPTSITLPGERISTEQAKDSLGKEVLVAGRIMSLRSHGSIIFADLKDFSGSIQIFFQKKVLGERYSQLSLFDIGDFIAVKGKVDKTQAGEITVFVSDFQFLSKAIRPLPSSWYGLKDVEERYRKRYLDILFNKEVKERFLIRTKLVREIRNYLDSLGFQEVETPTLQPLYGGANAKPFKTHLNALNCDMYLRIADELYLKRLLVGGYERVYEICKDFRNEGMDLTHNPEFTMIEYYEAYADYHRVMDVTEGLFKHLALAIFGKMEMKVGEKRIDISKKWPRVKMVDVIKEKLGIDVLKETKESLVGFCKENSIELVGGEDKGQLIYTIFEHKVTDLLLGPIWVIDYPESVSPLAKGKRDEPGWVERFEGYIGGKEICDGWSELNDPLIQRARFESDIKAARKDKEEAQQVDEDFLEAMEYGMPPIGGIGIGIDRLTMFFTNTWSIKEVIIFPTMRPLRRKKN